MKHLCFEALVIKDPANHTFKPQAYLQFVYDNADNNTSAIDGMGGILMGLML